MPTTMPSTTSTAETTSISKEGIAAKRREFLAKKLSVAYGNANPLHMVRGEGQYMYDNENNKYLDTRNNVAHVGHTHARVVAAVQRQVGLLNTNTRYLHENIVNLAEKLLSKCPGKKEGVRGGGGKFEKVRTLYTIRIR